MEHRHPYNGIKNTSVTSARSSYTNCRKDASMPNTILNKKFDFTTARPPLATCFVLLLIAGFIYIAGFGKGIAYGFCYTILPAGAGVLASIVFRKLRFAENITGSPNKIKAIYLSFFTLHIFVLSMIQTPDGLAPSLLILYIPMVYSMYVSIIPIDRAKAILCALFCAGVTTLSFFRSTVYADDGLIVILLSLFAISVVAVRNNRFGCASKLGKYATIIVAFSAVFLFLLLFSPVSLFFTTAPIPSNITSISITEIMQTVGLVPVLFVCTLYLAMAVLALIHTADKTNFFKYITISIITVFALSLLMNFCDKTGHLSGNFGLPFLECTELSTVFILMFTLIILHNNKRNASDPSLENISLCVSYSKGKLIIIQHPSVSKQNRHVHKLIGHKPEEAVLFLTADVVCDRLVRACQNIGSPEQHPESVFPEIADNTVSMIAIDKRLMAAPFGWMQTTTGRHMFAYLPMKPAIR